MEKELFVFSSFCMFGFRNILVNVVDKKYFTKIESSSTRESFEVNAVQSLKNNKFFVFSGVISRKYKRTLP